MSVKKILAVILPVLSVFAAHFIATNMYASMCANLSLTGFLTSFLTTSSPFCNSLLTLMNVTNQSYSTFVSGLIGGVVALFTVEH